MQMETNYKIRKNRIIYIIGQVIGIEITLLLSKIITCPFKNIFHIPCPFCGMTRAYKAFLKLDFKKAMHYNILFLPIVIIFIILNSIFIYEILKNKKIVYLKINKKKGIVIIIIMIISMIWGILHEI